MIRLLGTGDVDACMGLSAEAGWNQTADDWRTAMAAGPECCWGFEDGGEVVGTTTAITYGEDLAWIGMVLVRGDRRRRGIARRLMLHALDWLDARGVATVKLDATDFGRPLYLELGFVDEQPIERWAGVGRAGLPSEAGEADFRLDDFEAERGALLKRLSAAPGAETFAAARGFLLTRPGANARFLGPLVAEDRETAKRLVEDGLAGRAGAPFFWDLLPERAQSAELGAELGFERRRRLMRMARPGGGKRSDSARVWAAAGFEYG